MVKGDENQVCGDEIGEQADQFLIPSLRMWSDDVCVRHSTALGETSFVTLHS